MASNPFPTGVRYSWQNYHRPDPELAMIDMKRQHQRAKDERLPGETLHDALRRVMEGM